MQKLLEAGNIIIFLSMKETQNAPLSTYYFSSCGSYIWVLVSVRLSILPAGTGKPVGAMETEDKLKQMVLMLHYQPWLCFEGGIALGWI